MKPNSPMTPDANALSRRRVFAGAGAVGAVAAVAAVLPVTPSVETAEARPTEAPPEQGGGYRESAHVLHYYRTARV